ncbi:hypothetical protein [Actinoplanes aureus]|uniref:Uncharacterized protein n=1 Tax=Actinoplanes aureus TaxID=2792083 RepID=A0A931CJX4_9ACTN|nr:hypothetical protein [Actinoplanes aureus]MBG0568446.1 hypothetical protein [Actinoplanes aureus]
MGKWRWIGTAGGFVLLLLFGLQLVNGSVADTVATATFLFSDPFETWLADQAILLFWVGSMVILLLSVVIEMQIRAKANLKEEMTSALEAADIDKKAVMEEARAASETAAASKAAVEEALRTARAELEELGKAPATHDQRLFARFETEFPLDGAAIKYLTNWFNGERWEWRSLEEIAAFNANWQANLVFLDPEMQECLANLRTRTARFMGEIGVNTFKTNAYEESSVLDENRFPTHGEYQKRADELVQLGDDVVVAHRELLHLGHQKRLA